MDNAEFFPVDMYACVRVLDGAAWQQTDFADSLHELLRIRYPRSACSFIVGSQVSGVATKYSDVDIYVLDDLVTMPMREQIITDFPFQVSLMSTVVAMNMLDTERASGVPNLCSTFRNAEFIDGDASIHRAIVHKATQILEAGPGYSASRVLRSRHAVINNYLKLLKHRSSTDIQIGLITKLVRSVVRYLQMRAGQWIYDVAYCKENLDGRIDYDGFVERVSIAFSGNVKPLLVFVKGLMECDGALNWSTYEHGPLPLFY